MDEGLAAGTKRGGCNTAGPTGGPFGLFMGEDAWIKKR